MRRGIRKLIALPDRDFYRQGLLEAVLRKSAIYFEAHDYGLQEQVWYCVTVHQFKQARQLVKGLEVEQSRGAA